MGDFKRDLYIVARAVFQPGGNPYWERYKPGRPTKLQQYNRALFHEYEEIQRRKRGEQLQLFSAIKNSAGTVFSIDRSGPLALQKIKFKPRHGDN